MHTCAGSNQAGACIHILCLLAFRERPWRCQESYARFSVLPFVSEIVMFLVQRKLPFESRKWSHSRRIVRTPGRSLAAHTPNKLSASSFKLILSVRRPNATSWDYRCPLRVAGSAYMRGSSAQGTFSLYREENLPLIGGNIRVIRCGQIDARAWSSLQKQVSVRLL